MPTMLTVDRLRDATLLAGERLLDVAMVAGWDAPVPTCPSWDVRALVAHQAMVHRWAAAHLRCDDPGAVPNQTSIQADVADLDSYYREGLALLIRAIDDAPDDLVADTFLADAPAPRVFWARRQAHETTMHMVDALAASLGRVPTAHEVAHDVDLAVDGLDELLRGFFTRGRSKLFDGTPTIFVVAPTDAPRWWVVHVDERLSVAPDGTPPPAEVVTFSGTAAALHLALWNRGDEIGAAGPPSALLDRWRSTQRVRWS
jgi:uncharacterized protein (TIGR03083 family)